MITRCHFILYVQDLQRSLEFYRAVLADAPTLVAPGMVEFTLPGGAILGLMPIEGINRLLGESLPIPVKDGGPPKAELYLIMEEASAGHRRALEAGAREISPLLPRDWGHLAAYVQDPDGHVLALAQEVPRSGWAIEFA